MSNDIRTVRFLPPSSNPANKFPAQGYRQAQRKLRLNRTEDDPQPRSPLWPDGDEARPPYPLMPPPLPLNGKQLLSRTCEVCGCHFALSDGNYYEHMKTYHPWAPRSHRHGVYRPPGPVDANIGPNDPARYDPNLPDLDHDNPHTQAQIDRIEAANRLATYSGFGSRNPDGPPGFSVNKTEKRALLAIFGLDTLNPESLPPNTLRIGRVIPPTCKDGTSVYAIFAGPAWGSRATNFSIFDRGALKREGLLPPENSELLPAGSLVFYENTPGTALPWFRSLTGEKHYIPWRMIQPLYLPFGLPVDVPITQGALGPGFLQPNLPLPISTALADGTVSNGGQTGSATNPNNWIVENRELLLRLGTTTASTTRVLDFQSRIGDYDTSSLANFPNTPWNISIERDWLRNHIAKMTAATSSDRPPTDPGTQPAMFRLGRIIGPVGKGGRVPALTTLPTGDFISVSSAKSNDEWKIGSLVLYLSEDDHPSPRFRNVNGAEKIIPRITIQRIYRPFDLPEDFPITSEGVGLPIVKVDQAFTPNNPMDQNLEACSAWDARKSELLLYTATELAQLEAGADPVAGARFKDYERHSGDVDLGQGLWTRVPRLPWGVRVNGANLLTHFGVAPVSAPTRNSTPATNPTPASSLAPPTNSAPASSPATINNPAPTNPAPKTPPPKTPSPKASPPKTPSPKASPAKTPAPKISPAKTSPAKSPAPKSSPAKISPAKTSPTKTPAPKTPSPETSPPKSPPRGTIPLLLTSEFSAYVGELDAMQTTHPFVSSTAESIRAYINKHVGELNRQNLIRETQATADWRPSFWTNQVEVLELAPLDITTVADTQAVARMLAISRKLKIGGLASPTSPPPGSPPSSPSLPGQNKYFNKAELEKIQADLLQMQRNESGKNNDFDEAIKEALDLINYELLQLTAGGVTKEDDTMVTERIRRWNNSNPVYQNLAQAGRLPKSISGSVWWKFDACGKLFGSKIVPTTAPYKDPLNPADPNNKPPKETSPSPCEPGLFSANHFKSIAQYMNDILRGARNSDHPFDLNVVRLWERVGAWAEFMSDTLTRAGQTCESKDMALARQNKWFSHPNFYKGLLGPYQGTLTPRDLQGFEHLIEIVTAFVDYQPPLPPRADPAAPPPEEPKLTGLKAWLPSWIRGETTGEKRKRQAEEAIKPRKKPKQNVATANAGGGTDDNNNNNNNNNSSSTITNTGNNSSGNTNNTSNTNNGNTNAGNTNNTNNGNTNTGNTTVGGPSFGYSTTPDDDLFPTQPTTMEHLTKTRVVELITTLEAQGTLNVPGNEVLKGLRDRLRNHLGNVNASFATSNISREGTVRAQDRSAFYKAFYDVVNAAEQQLVWPADGAGRQTLKDYWRVVQNHAKQLATGPFSSVFAYDDVLDGVVSDDDHST